MRLRIALIALGLVLTGGGCSSFRGLDLDLSLTSGPSLRFLATIKADAPTNVINQMK